MHVLSFEGAGHRPAAVARVSQCPLRDRRVALTRPSLGPSLESLR